jgi:hypothetical protein
VAVNLILNLPTLLTHIFFQPLLNSTVNMNESSAIERSIWRPSNLRIEDSAENLKKVITGKSNDNNRGIITNNVIPTQTKDSVTDQAHRMTTIPSQGIVKGTSPSEKPIHHRKMTVALPPLPSNRSVPKPKTSS